MGQVISIGKEDYVSLRENHYFYIDKTDFIRQWWKNADDITLITRPRRFGKTLNMSMLNCFFQDSMQKGETFLRDFPFGKRRNIASCREPIR